MILNACPLSFPPCEMPSKIGETRGMYLIEKGEQKCKDSSRTSVCPAGFCLPSLYTQLLETFRGTRWWLFVWPLMVLVQQVIKAMSNEQKSILWTRKPHVKEVSLTPEGGSGPAGPQSQGA